MNPHASKGLALSRTAAAIGLALSRRQPHPSDSHAEGKGPAPPPVEAGDRGRETDRPREIPAKGWKDIVLRTSKEFRDDEIPMISAGVTFYTLLALFPGVGAFVALWGLFADVAEAQRSAVACPRPARRGH